MPEGYSKKEAKQRTWGTRRHRKPPLLSRPPPPRQHPPRVRQRRVAHQKGSHGLRKPRATPRMLFG